MLVFDLDPMFKVRGITRKYTFLKKIGLSHMVAQRFVAGDTKTIRSEHVELMCLALKCTPNDLMRWKPNEGQSVPDDHPLNELIGKEDNMDVFATVRDLPLEKMDELKHFLREMKK